VAAKVDVNREDPAEAADGVELAVTRSEVNSEQILAAEAADRAAAQKVGRIRKVEQHEVVLVGEAVGHLGAGLSGAEGR
jgi:hypothetical protein